MANTFFISDTHFFHANVLRFDSRPWSTVEEMNEEMRRRWNLRVTPKDTVYILGDYTWKTGDEHIEFLKSLNGQKRLIMGNHDFKHASKKYRELFESIKDYDDIVVTLKDGNKQRVILSHYFIPFYNGHRYGTILLHGHSHNTEEAAVERAFADYLNEKEFKNRIYNVGSMYLDYKPCTLDEIIEIYSVLYPTLKTE